MKKHIASLVAALLMSNAAVAGSNGSVTNSEASALVGLSVIAAPLTLIYLPAVMVSEVVRSSTHNDKDKVKVTVTSDKGKETITLPRSVVDKADLKSGDSLTVTRARSGALLSKNATPLAYIVPPEQANLSRSHELSK